MARTVEVMQSPELLRWAEEKLHAMNTRAAFKDDSPVVAVHDDSKILGVVVYTHYNGANVEMNIITDSPRWATKGFIKQCFEFAFHDLGVNHITTLVRSDNERSIKLTEGLGFTVEGRMRCSIVDFDDKAYDGIVFGMLKHECRWL